MINDFIDEDEWKPLSDLSPLKVDQNFDGRASIFYKFDPKMSRNKNNKKFNSELPKPRDLRLTNIFSQPASRLKNLSSNKSVDTFDSLKEESEHDEEVEVFKEANTLSPKANDSNVPSMSKKEFEADKKKYKSELLEKIKDSKLSMSSELKSARTFHTQACKQYYDYDEIFLKHFTFINDSCNVNISSNFESNSFLKNKNIGIVSCRKLSDEIRSYRSLCDSSKEQRLKLLPEQAALNELKEKTNKTKSEFDELVKMNKKLFENVTNSKEELKLLKLELEQQEKQENDRCNEENKILEKEKKMTYFELESAQENLKRAKEDYDDVKKMYNEFK